MAITVKHSKVSTIPDDADTSLVRPSDWNADHTLVGTVPVANGGTGAATLTGYVIGNGTSAMTASTTIPSGDVSGLGTMATQNANAIAVTGGTINGTTIGATTASTGAFTYLSTNSSTSTTPALSYNASNSAFVNGATVSGSYLQNVMQNKSGTAGASTNFAVSNDLGTDSTYYGEFGMNSSVYSAGTPADFFSINNGIYYSGHDGDVTVGSGNGYKTYLAWGTVGQSAHVINASGALGLNTNITGTSNFGTSGQVLTSGGSAATPTWATPTTGTVTSVAALTLGTTGTDLSSSVATGTTTPVITLQVPTASATNRGALSAADWTTFNNKGSGTVTSVATTVPAFLSVTGSPITSSGTLAISLSGTALPVLNGGTGTTTSTGTGSVVLGTRPTIAITNTGLTLQDATDNTKQAQFAVSGVTTGTTVTYTMPATTSVIINDSSTQSIGGQKTFSAATQNIGSATGTSTANLAYGATTTGLTKTVNIGTAGLAGSTTTITIGSTTGTNTTTVNGVLKQQTFTVATLPSASTSGTGARSFVTDALAPAFGATVVTGGAVAVPVYSDGTNWKVG